MREGGCFFALHHTLAETGIGGGAAHLEDVQELKGLHLKAEGAVHKQQHQVSILGCVDHGIEILYRDWTQEEDNTVQTSR